MSADNWAYCPKCIKTAADKKAALAQQATEAYGKVSAEDYSNLLKIANADSPKEETLREDYELGMTRDGVFEVSYNCYCCCGFKFTFTHVKKAEL